MILYVNQGNGVVNGSAFGSMLEYASNRGFNTVFFQAYRQGSLWFSPTTLSGFVAQAHAAKLKIFFALYITDQTQVLPSSIFSLGEDGVSLDMSGLSFGSQKALLTELRAQFNGTTAVTTTNMTSTLKPDLLILETYGADPNPYIHTGIVASVGAFTTSSVEEYQSEFQYALQNSDGVMVFDYAGMVQRGY